MVESASTASRVYKLIHRPEDAWSPQAPPTHRQSCRRQAQVEETRRVLRVCDAAGRAIDDQVSRSSGGAPPKKWRLSRDRWGGWSSCWEPATRLAKGPFSTG